MTRKILQQRVHPPQTVAAPSSRLTKRRARPKVAPTRWTYPQGPLDSVQYWADRIEICIDLLHESTDATDDLVDIEQVRVVIDALVVQSRYLVDSINETSEWLTKTPTGKEAV